MQSDIIHYNNRNGIKQGNWVTHGDLLDSVGP